MAGRQRANLILLGVILLIGFTIPVVQVHYSTGARNVEFINIMIVAQDSAPISVKILYLIPGIAGIGLFVLQGVTRHPVRGIVIIFLAATPVLIALTDLQNVGVQSLRQKHLPPEAAFLMLVVFLGLIVAPMAMLVGIRSRSYRPDSPLAYWFGVAGAGAWFIFLAAPVLGAEQGTMFMMLPIKMINQSGVDGVSMGLLVLMACASISAAICIINRPTTDALKAQNLANMAHWTLLVGFVVFILCLSGKFINGFQALMGILKSLCWFGGMFLLLPTGVTDLVVGRFHHHEHETPEIAHPHMAPPDIPRRAV